MLCFNLDPPRPAQRRAQIRLSVHCERVEFAHKAKILSLSSEDLVGDAIRLTLLTCCRTSLDVGGSMHGSETSPLPLHRHAVSTLQVDAVAAVPDLTLLSIPRPATHMRVRNAHQPRHNAHLRFRSVSANTVIPTIPGAKVTFGMVVLPAEFCRDERQNPSCFPGFESQPG